MIEIEDFKKCEIKIGKVVAVEIVPEADKLLKLTIDLGEENPRQILSGIREKVVEPNDLVGRLLPVLVNLVPRKIRGLESQGMILAATDEGGQFSLLTAENNLLSPGAEVR